MTHINDLFFYPIARPITQVIKVDDLRQEEVAQELSEYVVTPQIEEHIIRFFERFVATRKGQQRQTDEIGVWLSGFFGSGKSHLAKVLGYLLDNRSIEVEGTSREAIDLFLERVPDDSPRKQELRGLLTQLRNFFTNETLMFQIKSHEDLLSKERESIAVILYRRYLASLGLSDDPWIGQLELLLQHRGRYDDFCAAIQQEEGEPWHHVRGDFAMIRPSIVRAMRQVMPETYHSDDEASRALDDMRETLRLTPASLTEKLSTSAAAQDAAAGERSFKLVFIVDEMGQFIGDDGNRLLELQTIAEEFAKQGHGRLWLIVTAQEALDEVVKGVKQKRADFARIMDRFHLKLGMTSEQIEHVIGERLLKKRPSAHASLADLFSRFQGQISDLAVPESKRTRIAPTLDEFERSYPFLPYQFDVMQHAFAALRAKGGMSTKLSGAERSMLGVVQGLLNAPAADFAHAHIGRLVTLDEVYDQVLDQISGNDRRAINDVATSVPNGDYPPQQVLKAVFLLNQVEWLPRTLDNMARVLMPTADGDFQQHKAAVAQALTALKEARYLVEVKGEYRYLSAAERGIEDTIASYHVKHYDIQRAARDLLKTNLREIGRINYEQGLASFDVALVADDETIKSSGEITLKVYSPIVRSYKPDVTVENVRDMESPGDTSTVFWLPGDITDPLPNLERLLRLEAVVNSYKGRERDDDERGIFREKDKEINALREGLAQTFNRALFIGTVIYDGDATPLDGKTTQLNTIFNRELSKVVPKVYTRFDLAAVRVTEKSISEMLTTRPTNLPNVESGLRLWDSQGHINTHAPVVQPVLEELQRRGLAMDGKTLLDSFERAPFGWNPVVLRIVLAALFRAGTITVMVGQRQFTDPNEAPAQEALTKLATFKRALFDYDPTGGLTLEQRREARRQLDLLFDRQVEDTTNKLANTLREELQTLQRDNQVLLAQVGSITLPVDDALFQGESVLTGVLGKPRPDAIVKAFLEQVNAIKRLQELQQRVQRFFAQGYDQDYRHLRRLVDVVERARTEVQALDTEPVRNALSDLQALEAARTLVEKWSDAQQLGNTIRSAYQQVYADLFAQRTTRYQQAYEQVALFGMVPREIACRIVDAPGPWDETELAYSGQTATLLDLYHDIQMVMQRQTSSIAALQAEAEHQLAGDYAPDQAGKQTKHIGESKTAAVLVQVRDYFGDGMITDPDEFQQKLTAFQKRVQEALQQGQQVLIK